MVSLPKDIPVGKSKLPPLLMFKIYAQTERKMCIEANVCKQNQELHRIKFTHKFFTFCHPYQSNDNVNTKTIFIWRASGFSFVKKASTVSVTLTYN